VLESGNRSTRGFPNAEEYQLRGVRRQCTPIAIRKVRHIRKRKEDKNIRNNRLKKKTLARHDHAM